MSTVPAGRRVRVGTCCEIMKLVLERQQANGLGLSIATSFNMKTGIGGDALVLYFRKAKKGDTGKYGHGKPYANSTFAPVRFCPFCGEATVPAKKTKETP